MWALVLLSKHQNYVVNFESLGIIPQLLDEEDTLLRLYTISAFDGPNISSFFFLSF